MRHCGSGSRSRGQELLISSTYAMIFDGELERHRRDKDKVIQSFKTLDVRAGQTPHNKRRRHQPVEPDARLSITSPWLPQNFRMSSNDHRYYSQGSVRSLLKGYRLFLKATHFAFSPPQTEAGVLVRSFAPLQRRKLNIALNDQSP
jgi:hypothetical protein